jgi:hypothetical protein
MKSLGEETERSRRSIVVCKKAHIDSPRNKHLLASSIEWPKKEEIV